MEHDWRTARDPIVVGALAVVAFTVVSRTSPYAPGHYLPCPLYAVTGLYCAGCGGMRATWSLAHLDLAGAWDMNPLLVVLAPVAVVAWAAWSWRVVRGRGPAVTVVRPRSVLVPWVVLAVAVGYSVLRNVPALAPWLAP